MELPPGLLHVIANTHLFTDGLFYVILRMPLDQVDEAAKMLATLTQPFKALVLDKDEVTVILPHKTWEEIEIAVDVLAESPEYRLITFDLPLDLGLVGYLATLSGVLAEQGISIFPLSAFSRDHILVQREDFDRAWTTLRKFIRSCQELEAAETYTME